MHESLVLATADMARFRLEALYRKVSHQVYKSLLVQIYTAGKDRAQINSIISVILDVFPKACVVGASSIGEIVEGRLITNELVVGFTFFQETELSLQVLGSNRGSELEDGRKLAHACNSAAPNRVGTLLLSQPLSLHASEFLRGFSENNDGKAVFGGGAGNYSLTEHSILFTADDWFEHGAIAVAFSGKDLFIEYSTYLGWKPLSRPMKITSVNGLRLQTVDGKPAFDVYRHYLNIQADENFFMNALEFPFLFERNGVLIARVPVSVNDDGSLNFIADIKPGESFRIGYGDIDRIIRESRQMHASLATFKPDVVFLYSCGCRRFLLQDEVNLETLPLQNIAPTFGFYTYGEFYGDGTPEVLNSAMVAVGMREGQQGGETENSGGGQAGKTDASSTDTQDHQDPYADKHIRVVSRLLTFIDVVTTELEESIEHVTKLSKTDQLTRLSNRMSLDELLDEQIRLSLRYGSLFSVILLDVDHFKSVNDTHGHLVGDKILSLMAALLQEFTRDTDIVGRWGGEEFLIITPNTGLNDALRLAEKLRAAIELYPFPVPNSQTASFGVASYQLPETRESLISRADKALYKAKEAGRNRVASAK